jgi:hypothetical protein
MLRRDFVFTAILGLTAILLMIAVTVEGNNLLLVSPLLGMIALFMWFILASERQVQNAPGLEPAIGRKVRAIVLLAFLCIAMAYCAGIAASGGLHLIHYRIPPIASLARR